MDINIKNKFIDHARQVQSMDESIIDIYLVKIINLDQEQYGFLWVSLNDEGFDNHCPQCQQDSPAWLMFRAYEDFPEYWSAGIGPTKYKKILSGEITLSPCRDIIFQIQIVESLLAPERMAP